MLPGEWLPFPGRQAELGQASGVMGDKPKSQAKPSLLSRSQLRMWLGAQGEADGTVLTLGGFSYARQLLIPRLAGPWGQQG